MKIALAQQNYHIGNFERIQRKSSALSRKQKSREPILSCLLNYVFAVILPRDFLEFNDFINKCYAAIDTIKQYADTIAVVIGGPQRNANPQGKDLFNAAWFLYEKEIKATVQKTCLPTYDVFDEYRYFEPAYDWNVIPFKDKKIALTICEDIWNLGDNPLYRVCPMDELMKQQPDLMINISASPFDYDHDDDRKEVIRVNVLKYSLPMFYCNAVGSQTEIVFDGGSLVMDAKGNVLKEMKYFEEDFAVVELPEMAKHIGLTEEAVKQDSVKQSFMNSQFDKDMRVSKISNPDTIVDLPYRAKKYYRKYTRHLYWASKIISAKWALPKPFLAAVAV